MQRGWTFLVNFRKLFWIFWKLFGRFLEMYWKFSTPLQTYNHPECHSNTLSIITALIFCNKHTYEQKKCARAFLSISAFAVADFNAHVWGIKTKHTWSEERQTVECYGDRALRSCWAVDKTSSSSTWANKQSQCQSDTKRATAHAQTRRHTPN